MDSFGIFKGIQVSNDSYHVAGHIRDIGQICIKWHIWSTV